MVTTGITITGTERLTAVGHQLMEAGQLKIKRELLAAIRTEAQAAIPDIRDSARETLPAGGGLAVRVAEQVYGVRSSLAGSVASVRLAGRGMKELYDINAGKLRHPVYGNREVWRSQSVPEGFFSKPVEERAPEIRAAILVAVETVAAEITAAAEL